MIQSFLFTFLLATIKLLTFVSEGKEREQKGEQRVGEERESGEGNGRWGRGENFFENI